MLAAPTLDQAVARPRPSSWCSSAAGCRPVQRALKLPALMPLPGQPLPLGVGDGAVHPHHSSRSRQGLVVEVAGRQPPRGPAGAGGQQGQRQRRPGQHGLPSPRVPGEQPQDAGIGRWHGDHRAAVVLQSCRSRAKSQRGMTGRDGRFLVVCLAVARHANVRCKHHRPLKRRPVVTALGQSRRRIDSSPAQRHGQGPLPAEMPVKVAVSLPSVWVRVQMASTPLAPALPVPSAASATV